MRATLQLASMAGLVAAAAALGYVAGRSHVPLDAVAVAPTSAATAGHGADPARTRGDDPRSLPPARARARAADGPVSAEADSERAHAQHGAVAQREPLAAAPEGDTGADAAGEGAATPASLAAEAEACAELLGQPIAIPPGLAPRFSAPALSRSVTAAMGQAGAQGDVEGVDCSEFPCIVFARLAGDEEDLEEIERAAALDEYEDDVLTLLLWATTVEPEARTHPSARETGLFALAYYGTEDRAAHGDELDRRIRARVLEVWNAERPGPAARP
ncbi:MAG: hypothetical protein K1X88_25870 [Nannocystaceae bacterium]|nr:hypothetical protein [Nannocystaceae bacterium]